MQYSATFTLMGHYSTVLAGWGGGGGSHRTKPLFTFTFSTIHLYCVQCSIVSNYQSTVLYCTSIKLSLAVLMPVNDPDPGTAAEDVMLHTDEDVKLHRPSGFPLYFILG